MTVEKQSQTSSASSGRQPSKATISVSIVTYNTPAEELRKLLESLRQSDTTAAVTVVDNSPTDMMRPVVESLGARYLSPGSNLGFGRGHNRAMESAIESSTYHIVCNPDIICEPGVLSGLAAFMDASPEVGLVMPRIIYPGGEEQRLCKLLPTPTDLLIRRFLGNLGNKLFNRSLQRYELREIDLRESREVPSLSGCFMFLRSETLRKTGLFDTRFFMYMEDVDLCRRIGAVSRTVFFPYVSVTHNYAKGSYKNFRLLRYHIESALKYFFKWGWFLDPKRKALNNRLEPWPRNR